MTFYSPILALKEYFRVLERSHPVINYDCRPGPIEIRPSDAERVKCQAAGCSDNALRGVGFHLCQRHEEAVFDSDECYHDGCVETACPGSELKRFCRAHA